MATAAESVRERLARVDWSQIESELDAHGYARLPGLLRASECREVKKLYADAARFRSFIELGPRRYGDHGDYRYFAYPLPAQIEALRKRLYPPLARIANRWQERLGRDERYPATLAAFLQHCCGRGQERPTPLVLRYDAGGWNALHQDVYGEVAFPLQVACLLSDPTREFEGGEFLLTEQRPRAQSKGEAIALRRGEGLVFPNRERPVEGAKGAYRVQVRHGVSRVLRGERFTLGLIFHDAL